jgi:hypothetical protein
VPRDAKRIAEDIAANDRGRDSKVALIAAATP